MADPDLTMYELKAIIIHRGGPYGGHYHAYIRDDLNEGNWNLQLPETFDLLPSDLNPKVTDAKATEAKADKPVEEEIKEEDIDWSSMSN